MSSLSVSDIVGIAVGVPTGVMALVSAIIAFCAWRYPRSPVGQVGTAVLDRVVSIRGGDARGGRGRKRGGDARGGDVNISYAGGGGGGNHAIGGMAAGGRASAV
ncbi:hypothetical protein B0H63DRAFT_515947 [Podospora didyma]|uniref:Uncharacterized protein n=1 Tax=Podospora didyma TaxID=330526 RepID=A0AAE0P3H4_9PEZI|nr:hypothetical protein B0H63DRAFT_515947 [Podospora didyma]